MTRTIFPWREALALPFLCLSLTTTAGAADEPANLAHEAIEANPTLEAMRARITELSALAGAAGTWSDPVIGVEYSNAPVDTFALNDHPMTAVQFQAQQTLPPWGWSRLREEVAESRVLESEHALAEAKTQLRREVFDLYWQLALSRMLAAVTREHVAWAEDLLEALRARYETGRAGQNELLRLQVLRDRLRDDLGDFARADRVLSAALSRTLSREPDSAFSTPPDLVPLPVGGSGPEWVAMAREERPELQRLEDSVRTAEKSAELARVEGWPDVSVWLKYRLRTIDTEQDDGTDQVSAGVSIPIPWGSAKRSQAERAAQMQAARAGRARLAAELDRVESEAESIHARWTRAFEQAVAYREHLIPDARAALETSYSDYTVGRADFATLFDAEATLLDLERTLYTSAAETHIQAAAADAVIGAAHSGGRP